MAPLQLGKYEDDIDQRTRWWSSYPATGFNERTHARETLDNYLTDVFTQPRCLARSASATNLTYYHHVGDRTDKPLHRSPSYSSLSPSHALDYDCRVPTRYVSTFRPQHTATEKWYSKAYAPQQFGESLRYGAKMADEYERQRERPVYGRTWYFPGLLDSGRFLRDTTSYVRGSINHDKRYVSDRLRYDAFSTNYIHDSYDCGVDYRYLRFMKGQPKTFVNMKVGLPRFWPSSHQYRMFRINRRVIY